jgi:deazaflavin-dependent oxidoreductase (nitroreductase family)
MHLPYFLRRVNRVFTNPLLGSVAWLVPPLAVIHHRGRRTGRPYRTPVVCFRTMRGFIVPMTYGRDVDWALNLVAAGGGEVERVGRRVAVRNPRIVDGAVAGPALPAPVRGPLLAADLPGYVLVDCAEPTGDR